MSHSLQPHGLQHCRPPCPSPTPGACSNSRPSSQWCHPTISFSIVPFSSCLQFFPASVSFPLSQFFASGGQSIGASVSASVLPMTVQDWSPLGWTGWISCCHTIFLSFVFHHSIFILYFIFPQTVYKCSSFSTSLPTHWFMCVCECVCVCVCFK